MVRVSRKEAAARLKVSKSTLDRMIKLGEIATEREQHGRRHTVWVLMDELTEDTNDTNDVANGKMNGHLPGFTEHTGDDTGVVDDPGGDTNGHLAASSEHTGRDTGAVEDINETTSDDVLCESSEHTEHTSEAEARVLQTKVDGLEDLVALYRERLADADWRYHEILQQMKGALWTAALPAAQRAHTRQRSWRSAVRVNPGLYLRSLPGEGGRPGGTHDLSAPSSK